MHKHLLKECQRGIAYDFIVKWQYNFQVQFILINLQIDLAQIREIIINKDQRFAGEDKFFEATFKG